LADGQLREILSGNASDVAGKIMAVRSTNASKAWKLFTLVLLLNAPAHLLFGRFERISVDVGDLNGGTQIEPDPSDEDLPSLLEILQMARDRNFVRKAICSFRAGGPEGLFDAYEALTDELMERGASDFTMGMGTREWLIERGWATARQIDGFIDTVLSERRPTSDEPRLHEEVSLPEAEALV
jgi:hypothetical protein